jgi:DNA-binding MarR family transcriptional regulator
MSIFEQDRLRLFASVNFLMRRFLLAEDEYSPAQGRAAFNPLDFNILRQVEAFPGTRATDMAEALHVAPTTLQSGIDRLVRKGLIAKSSHPEDSRARAHRLTETGAELRAAIHNQDMMNMEAILATLSAEERSEILRLMDKVVEGLEG